MLELFMLWFIKPIAEFLGGVLILLMAVGVFFVAVAIVTLIDHVVSKVKKSARDSDK